MGCVRIIGTARRGAGALGMGTMKTSTRCLWCIGLLALGVHVRARAQSATTVPYGSIPSGATGYIDAVAGLAYTDNALLTSGAGKKGDGVAALGLAADYARVGMLNLNLLGNVERLEYLNHSYPGSFFGQFNGSAVFGRDTSPLQWQFDDSFGETMIDPLQAPNPLSLQFINDVATGPRLNLHFGLRDRLTLAGRYSRTTYQRSPLDTQTFEGALQASHALSGASFLALRGSFARTEYIDLAAVQRFSVGSVSNFNLWKGIVEFHSNYVRTRVTLRAGYNVLDFGHGGRTSAPVYQFSLSRQISPFSTIYFNAESSYSMNGASLGSANAQIGLQTGAMLNPSLAVAQPYNERSGSMGWTFQRARTTFSLNALVEQTIYARAAGPSINANHLDEGLNVTLGRQLRPRTRVQMWAQGYTDQYNQLHARTRRESVGVSFSQTFFRLTVSLYAERTQQSGSPGASNFQASSYHDDRVGVYAIYALSGAQQPGASLNGIPGMSGFKGGY